MAREWRRAMHAVFITEHVVKVTASIALTPRLLPVRVLVRHHGGSPFVCPNSICETASSNPFIDTLDTHAEGLEDRLTTERHHEISDDSRLEAGDRRYVGVAGGEDDGRFGKALAQPVSQPEPVLSRCLDVTEDHVCRAHNDFVESRLGVRGLRGLVAFSADPTDQKISNRRLVVNDEHQGHRTSRFFICLLGSEGVDSAGTTNTASGGSRTRARPS
jgi:hypothetical protein